MSRRGGFSAIICDSMKQLLRVISWGGGYVNYLIIPIDLIAPASVVTREKSKRCSKGRGSLGENEQIGLFPFVLLPAFRWG